MMGHGNFSVEAKHHFFALRSTNIARDIRAQFAAAVADQALNNDGANMSASLVFSVPHIPTGQKAKLAGLLSTHRANVYPGVTTLCPMGFRVDLYPEWASDKYTTADGKVHPGLTLHVGFEPQ